MSRIKNLKNSLLLTGLYAAILFVCWQLKIPCLFNRFLGFECPGCGMTRAVLSAVKLDFAAAFSHHPMFWSMPILYLYFLFNGKVFNKKALDIGILIFIALGFLISWIVKLV